MKKYALLPLLALIIVSMGSCETISGIFGAGMKAGAILTVVVIVIIVIIIFRLLSRRKS